MWAPCRGAFGLGSFALVWGLCGVWGVDWEALRQAQDEVGGGLLFLFRRPGLDPGSSFFFRALREEKEAGSRVRPGMTGKEGRKEKPPVGGTPPPPFGWSPSPFVRSAKMERIFGLFFSHP